MKLAVASIFLAFFVIGAYSAPKAYSFSGLDDVIIDATTIVDGKEVPADMKQLTKVEDMLKAMIHKHLDKKREAKKSAWKAKRAEKQAKVGPEAEAKPDFMSVISNFKGEDLSEESHEVIDKQTPGDTEAVYVISKQVSEVSKPSTPWLNLSDTKMKANKFS